MTNLPLTCDIIYEKTQDGCCDTVVLVFSRRSVDLLKSISRKISYWESQSQNQLLCQLVLWNVVSNPELQIQIVDPSCITS